jgi:hypothetical protein
MRLSCTIIAIRFWKLLHHYSCIFPVLFRLASLVQTQGENGVAKSTASDGANNLSFALSPLVFPTHFWHACILFKVSTSLEPQCDLRRQCATNRQLSLPRRMLSWLTSGFRLQMRCKKHSLLNKTKQTSNYKARTCVMWLWWLYLCCCQCSHVATVSTQEETGVQP